jgi:hypothetical protein
MTNAFKRPQPSRLWLAMLKRLGVIATYRTGLFCFSSLPSIDFADGARIIVTTNSEFDGRKSGAPHQDHFDPGEKDPMAPS